MTRLTNLVLVPLLMAGGSALAQTAAPTPTSTTAQTTASASATTAEMSEAEVRKIDTSANKITLKHGEIKNLDMPPMSMVFQVKDPALLSNVKAGDKVRFTADKINGAYTVLTLEPAR